MIAHVEETEPQGWFGAAALFGGVATYVAGVALFWWRVARKIKMLRIAAAAALVALVPIAARLPPLVAMSAIFACCAGLILAESWRYSSHRRQIRAARGH